MAWKIYNNEQWWKTKFVCFSLISLFSSLFSHLSRLIPPPTLYLSISPPLSLPSFKWLEYEFVDFEKLRNLPLTKSSLRKAKKLYRHIALQIHTDKLPSTCRDDNVKEMMVSILENAEKIKECISEPHSCVRDEL